MLSAGRTCRLHPSLEEFNGFLDAGLEVQVAHERDDQLPQADVHEGVRFKSFEADPVVDRAKFRDDVLLVLAEPGGPAKQQLDILKKLHCTYVTQFTSTCVLPIGIGMN